MEHPFLDVVEIKKKSLEEIQGTISDLTKRLSFAYRMSNQPMINQISMMLECYRRAYMELLNEKFSGSSNEGKIDIS